MSPNKREAHIVALAESWIGTPYRHQSCAKHIGCDCLGLVVGVWQELAGQAPDFKADYSRDWAETAKQDMLLDVARRHFDEIDLEAKRPGDVLLFRWSEFAVSKHLGILASDTEMIHAFERHVVCKVPLVASWRRRISGVFRFSETKRD